MSKKKTKTLKKPIKQKHYLKDFLSNIRLIRSSF